MAGLLGGIRVLIVEDYEDDREVLGQSLQFQGAGIEVVATATEAAVLLDGFDIVVTDYALPDHDGVWLLEQAMRRSPPVPVILLSGYAECQIRAIADAPFARKLLKPVDPLNLGVEIIKTLGAVAKRTPEIGGGSAASPWTIVRDLRVARRARYDPVALTELLAACAESIFTARQSIFRARRCRLLSREIRLETASLLRRGDYSPQPSDWTASA
jgi:CheY-like chemotaxis protein